MGEMKHIPVLYRESLSGLNIKPDGTYLDMTVGGFGHGFGICEQLNEQGIYIGLDMDLEAIERGKQRSQETAGMKYFSHTNFKKFEDVLNEHDIDKIDGCLMDLGVSSFQIDDNKRGFSFINDGPLDMRMNAMQDKNATDVVNTYSEDMLKEILYKYGEEKFAPTIARSIIRNRKSKEITTTLQLAEIVKEGVPKKYWYRGKHPATKAFQAIRIEVNEELTDLFETIDKVIDRLAKRGRICVISFHSLEDRIVKNTFTARSRGCDCPKDLPVCVCGKVQEIKLINKSPIRPTEDEISKNNRSRSAKLRVAEKL